VNVIIETVFFTMSCMKKLLDTKTLILCCSIIINVGLIVTLSINKVDRIMRGHLQEKHDNESLQRPDYWAIVGWNSTLRKLNLDCDVCFFGHSQIEMSDFQQFFPDKKIVTLGYPGDNVIGMLHRVDQIKCVRPDKIFLMCGVNSLGMPDTVFQKKYALLVDSIRCAAPGARLYVFNILPERDGITGQKHMNAKICDRNHFIESFSIENGIVCIDLFSAFVDSDTCLRREYSIDGLHINDDGYKLWADIIKEYI